MRKAGRGSCGPHSAGEVGLSIALASGEAAAPSAGALADGVASRIEREHRPLLAPVINATGIIIHTGLGRAPLAEEAVRAVADAAGRYAPVELDLATGRRGRRSSVVRDALCRLTGAEAATVVNNNAAALLLVLSAVARNRGVIVSRGELIEIGGSFRLPEIMEAGGAVLREVGTTNRTRLGDYERAIDDTTAALMKVHTSNYRIEGFRQEVPIEELAALGKRRRLPVIHDTGSGALGRLDHLGVGAHEPSAAASIEAGADLVLFSGDKLLGGPQAGIIVGREALVAAIERQPLMRAMRVGKLTLAGLAATLEIHMDPGRAARRVPVLAMTAVPLADLERRGRKLIERLRELEGIGAVALKESQAYLGGGALPAEAVPSRALVIRAASVNERDLARRLRIGVPAVVGRVNDGALWLDLRTVFRDQDESLVKAMQAALP